MKRSVITLLFVVAMAFAGAGVAKAVVVYDNGAPYNLENARTIHGWRSADGFTFTEDTPVSSVRLWVLESSPDSFSGSLWYAIYAANVGGSPNTGQPLIQNWTEGANPTRTLSGTIYEMTFDLASFTALADVVYWLALHNADPTEADTLPSAYLYWRRTSSQVNGSPYERLDMPFNGR